MTSSSAMLTRVIVVVRQLPSFINVNGVPSINRANRCDLPRAQLTAKCASARVMI